MYTWALYEDIFIVLNAKNKRSNRKTRRKFKYHKRFNVLMYIIVFFSLLLFNLQLLYISLPPTCVFVQTSHGVQWLLYFYIFIQFDCVYCLFKLLMCCIWYSNEIPWKFTSFAVQQNTHERIIDNNIWLKIHRFDLNKMKKKQKYSTKHKK